MRSLCFLPNIILSKSFIHSYWQGTHCRALARARGLGWTTDMA